MGEFVLELGCEELPASQVRHASQQLQENLTRLLQEAGLPATTAESYATPRRLILGLQGISHRQPDSEKTSRGPQAKAAFDPQGNPTKALEGFCRAQSVNTTDIQLLDDYVWVTKQVPGRPAPEVIAEALDTAIRSITFDKTMRWGHHKTRFARPVRWILAVYEGQTVPFEFEGVRAANLSRGHRFDAPETFIAKTLQSLLTGLRQRHVEPDPAVRETKIRTEAIAVADGLPDLPEHLVEENTFLTEWPTAHQGTFAREFLELPDPVLVTAMAKHERFFPVRDQEGRITNRFVSIRNSGEEAIVRAGNEWVLNARFNDARFFFEEDKNRTLDDFLAATSRMLFQEKLGNVRDRADRLASLAQSAAKQTGADPEAARLAGLYAKADLATGLVNELSSLQGTVGGIYARRPLPGRPEGLPEFTAQAIAHQYDHLAAAENPASLALIFADQIDKLAGFLGLGLIPKGSSDPFALRRAVTVLLEAAWATPHPVPDIPALLQQAFDLYDQAKIKLAPETAKNALVELLAGRYESLLAETRHDILAAVLAHRDLPRLANPRQVKTRLTATASLAQSPATIQTLTRPVNIAAAAAKKSEPLAQSLDPVVLESPEGLILHDKTAETQARLDHAFATNDPASLVETLTDLAPPINGFFETTMVMAENPATRAQRLAVAQRASVQIARLADLTQIVIP